MQGKENIDWFMKNRDFYTINDINKYQYKTNII